MRIFSFPAGSVALVVLTFLTTFACPSPGQASTVEPDVVPHGSAANYIVGHMLMREKKMAEALPYLHLAYRAQPDVIDIASDFQHALAAQGYLQDAIEVANGLVSAYPDSLRFLQERAQLYLGLGKADRALDDLGELRRRGHITAAIVEVEAQILAAAGKIPAALKVYRDALPELPDDGPQLYLGMSDLMQKDGQVAEITDLMTEALALYPDNPQLWLIQGRALVVVGETEMALASARKADAHFATLTADSLNVAQGNGGAGSPSLPPDSFVVDLADFYAKRHDLAQALAILRPLSDAGQLGLTPSLWLARLLLGTGRTEDGTALVSNILERWPDSGRAWFLKAQSAEDREAWSEALPSLKKAVDLAPRDPEIRISYVRAMLVAWSGTWNGSEDNDSATSRRDAFQRHLDVAATLIPDQDFQGHLVLGYGYKAVGQFDEGAWHFAQAAENPDLKRTALLQSSICLDELDKTAQARRALETLHKEFPHDAEVSNSLGYFLAEKDVDLDLAADLVAEALAADPGNGAFLDSMGWVRYRQGNWESALDHLIQAVNVLPDDPVILEHLGMVLYRQGKSREARDVLLRALAQGGDRQRLQAVLADLDSDKQ